MWLYRLGNKTFSYRLPVHPHRAQHQLHEIGLLDSVQPLTLSRSEFKLCQKALASLVLQLIKLQQDALAHRSYLEPVDADQLATFMRPTDVLLAATDQVRHLHLAKSPPLALAPPADHNGNSLNVYAEPSS